MEGCAPSLVLGTKKGEVLMEGELMESLSLSPVSDMPMVLGDLFNPLVAISSLRATLFLNPINGFSATSSPSPRCSFSMVIMQLKSKHQLALIPIDPGQDLL